MTPQMYAALIDDIKERFIAAIENTKDIGDFNSYGAGYAWGYADALGELLESITGDACAKN